MRHLILLTSLALAGACGDTTSPATTAPPATEAAAHRKPDLRDARRALIEAGNEVSADIAANGVAEGLGDALASNVVALFPRKPAIRGRQEAAAFLAGDPVAPRELSWQVIYADVSADASQGFTWAQGSFTIDLGDGGIPRPGFFLTYWRRTERGRWRIAAFVLNQGGPQLLPLPEAFDTPERKHRPAFRRGEVKDFRRQLLAVDAAFSAASVKTGSGPAFERFAAPKAIAVSGGLIFGPAAIGQAFTGGPDDVISWEPRFVDAAASGDLGFTVGDATFDIADIPPFFTKYLTVWQRQKNGKWRFIADLGNSRPAPTP